MTQRNQLIECMDELETGMARIATRGDIWQDRLVYVLCKAVYLLLKEAVKK